MLRTLLSCALLNALLLQCTSEPSKPAEMPSGPESGQLQFPTTPGFDATSGGAAGTTAPAPPTPTVENAPAALPAETLRERTPLEDPQIAAVSDVTNTAEVDQATLARKKAKDAAVKKFAEMMLTHHGRAKQDQAALMAKLQLKPQESARSTELSAEAASVLSTLKSANPKDFDRLYIDAQVTAHRAALETLDKELIPNTKSVELRSLLQNMRQVVSAHLDEAQKIQQRFAESPSDAPKK